MPTDLIKFDEVKSLVERIEFIEGQAEEATTAELTDLFGFLKPLEKALTGLNKTVRAKLIEHREDGGEDDSGHRYLATNHAGVKLQRSIKPKLVPDAAQILDEAGYLKDLPREFDKAKALKFLKDLGADQTDYTAPVVTKKSLDAAHDSGIIPDEVLERCLDFENSENWSAIPVSLDAVKKALPKAA